MPGEIIVEIDEETSEVTISVRGVKGKSCVALTADLEKALGKVTGTKKTQEYYDRTEVKTGVSSGRGK